MAEDNGLLGAGLLGGASLLGGMLSGNSAANESRRNRAFQLWMSGHAYRQATRDMKRAGLNPMLAFSQGGASASGGSMANVHPDVLTPAVNTALSAMRNKAEMKNIEQNTLTGAATEVKTEMDSFASYTQAEKNKQETANAKIHARLLAEQIKGTSASAVLRDADIAKAKNDEAYAKSWLGRNISPMLRDLNSAGSYARDVRTP